MVEVTEALPLWESTASLPAAKLDDLGAREHVTILADSEAPAPFVTSQSDFDFENNPAEREMFQRHPVLF